VDLVRGLFQRDRRVRKWVVADGASGKRLQAELTSFISAGGHVEDFNRAGDTPDCVLRWRGTPAPT
jgi:hypothetical protein